MKDHELRYKKYSIDELIKHIDELTIKTLLYTQDLTPEFCIKYILAPGCSCCTEEEYITEEDVMRVQNFTQEQMDKARKIE